MDSGLPWLWITEYLAGFKEIDTDILHDLIEVAPEVPDDLEKGTREMVALRCLEDLFSRSNVLAFDDPSTTEPKVGFSLSESCEDVLQHILEETSTLAGPELSKWDLHPFVMHKRETMPKCALQQLKDTILEGTQTWASSLKEITGLVCANECGRTRSTYVGNNTVTSEPDGSATDAQIMPEKEISITGTNQKKDFLQGDGLSKNDLLPSKRKRDDLPAGDMTGHQSDSLDESNILLNAKKLKQDSLCIDQSTEQTSVPLHDELSEKLNKVTEGEYCDQANGFVDGIMQNAFPRDGCDCGANVFHHNKIVDSRIAENITEDPCGHEPANVTVDGADFTESRTSCGAPSIETQQAQPKDCGDGEFEQLCEEEVTSVNDEYHHEKTNIDSEKSRFLSSQGLLGCDYLPGWTEQNICVKCNKGGQLLACSSSSCTLLVHESCLSFPAKFDDKGKFYCPFCACSLAISKYREAKKRASLTKKKLVAFISMGVGHQHQKEHVERFQRKEQSHLRQDGCKIIQENEHLRDVGVSDGRKVREDDLVDKCEHGQATTNSKCDGHNQSCLNTSVPSVDQRGAEGGIWKEDLPQASTDPAERPVVALNNDGEETSGNEIDKFVISNYSIRSRRPLKKFTRPVFPQLRRQKLPWTAKEEEVLKEGVQKFTSVHDKNIPWVNILEYGSSVFHRSRSQVDLKDKWRNMCKASAKSK